MLITDFYSMADVKSQTGANKSNRLDCVASTGGYEPFEAMAAKARCKRFFCYLSGVPDTFTADAQRRADMAITNAKNISSLYVPDLDQPLMAWGDVKGTTDAVLFRLAPDYKGMEIFIARGLKNNARNLFRAWADGELDEEMEAMRQAASPTNAASL